LETKSLLGRSARAARSFTLLGLVRKAVEDFEEGSFGTRDTILSGMNFGVLNGKGGVTRVTWAAWAVASRGTKFFFFGATGLFASEMPLGVGAESGSFAFPGTLGLFAQRSTVGFGCSTGCSAYGGTADGFTSWAIFHFTHFFGATDRADGFFAVNFTFGTFEGFAVHLAFRAGANGVALGRAYRVVTQPFALWVASGGRGNSQDNSKSKDNTHSFCICPGCCLCLHLPPTMQMVV
jgi:hypothetical protein